MSQGDLANRTGLAQPAISRIEHGRRPAGFRATLILCAETCGQVTPRDLGMPPDSVKILRRFARVGTTRKKVTP